MKSARDWREFEQCHGPFNEASVYAMVGELLFCLHHFEALLKIAAGVLIETAVSNDDEIDATDQMWRLRRDTLGKIANRLREVVSLEVSFDVTFKRLIRRRNAFAHKLAAHTPFDFKGRSWLQNVPRFVFELKKDLVTVQKVFEAYLTALMHQQQGERHTEHETTADAAMRFKK